MADNAIAKKVNETVGKALSDPAFAEQLKQQGLAAIQKGAGSQEWQTYFANFAPSSGALASLGGANVSAANCTCNSATWTTLSTIVTPVPTCCGATTTTTTSTN
jgi:hypothetical protein